MPHEFTHVVHERLSGSEGGYNHCVAYLSMMEGLAIGVSEVVAPGRSDEEYLSLEPGDGWLLQCQAKERQLLAGIRAHLTDKGPDAMWRFTMGTGATGLKREAYYAGWRLVGHLTERGRTLAELARLTEAECASVLDEAVVELLA